MVGVWHGDLESCVALTKMTHEAGGHMGARHVGPVLLLIRIQRCVETTARFSIRDPCRR